MLYKVSFKSRISGSSDYKYIIARSESEALKKGKILLNVRKLCNNTLNSYGRYHVERI